jgi:antitoxin component of RelBE/YafQ-DinJ toxin-antitoxin module
MMIVVRSKKGKNQKIQIRLSEDESREMKAQAERLGLTISAYLRYLVRQEALAGRSKKQRSTET